MMDIVEERGMEMDMHRLPEILGEKPVVPVSARKRTGLDWFSGFVFGLLSQIVGNLAAVGFTGVNAYAMMVFCLLHVRLQWQP